MASNLKAYSLNKPHFQSRLKLEGDGPGIPAAACNRVTLAWDLLFFDGASLDRTVIRTPGTATPPKRPRAFAAGPACLQAILWPPLHVAMALSTCRRMQDQSH